MRAGWPRVVRLLLSTNRPGSVTRIVADTANVLVRLGVEAVVCYPSVDWWDFKRFTLSRLSRLSQVSQRIRMGWEGLAGHLFPRPWCGRRLHSLDRRVRTECFGRTPSAERWEADSITVVHPPYLLPHLIATLPHGGIRMVSVIHVNLEKAMRSPSPETAAWFTHWVAMERHLAIPRYATSDEAAEAAERLGIPIQRVIPGGLDLALFHPPVARSLPGSPVVLLYCDPNPQKGRQTGIEALRQVRRTFPGAQLHSVGHLNPGQARFFDRNLGYLHGEGYAQALRDCDIFVYPSHYDGFPAPPLQALASGAALVTTGVEGVLGYARDGENALICPPGDPHLLSAAVERLLREPDLRSCLQRQGPATARRFSAEESVRQMLHFLQEVLSGPGQALQKERMECSLPSS